MRITTRIAAGGDRSLTRIPLPHSRLEECINADRRVDLVRARRAFIGATDTDGYLPFVTEKTDDELVYFAALTFLDNLHDAMAEVIGSGEGDVHDGARTHREEVLERKMDRGRFAYCRQDVRRVRDGVRARVSCANPRGVVGQAEMEAETYATLCVQIWLRIAESVPWLKVDADARILARAAGNNREADVRRRNAARLACERYRAGFCSPCRAECPHCRGGMCVELEVAS